MRLPHLTAVLLCLLVFGIALPSHAQKVINRPTDPDAPIVDNDPDCSVEKKKMIQACKDDPCTPSCVKAHKAKKACHMSKHLLGPAESMDEKKAECNTQTPSTKDDLPALNHAAPER